MVINIREVIIPILILVSIVGLSFAYTGSVSDSSSLSSPPNQSQPWLGIISALEVTPQISKQTGLGVASGLLVLQVAPGGPAEKAGIKGGTTLKVIEGAEIPIDGDVITRIDGNAIRTFDDFRNHLMNKRVGDTLEFTLTGANDDIRSVVAKLEPRPA
jgi:serine protease Do